MMLVYTNNELQQNDQDAILHLIRHLEQLSIFQLEQQSHQISVHGFNGLRVILLEMNQGPTYEKLVTIGCLGGMAALIAYGSRTIIMTNMGMV